MELNFRVDEAANCMCHFANDSLEFCVVSMIRWDNFIYKMLLWE